LEHLIDPRNASGETIDGIENGAVEISEFGALPADTFRPN